MAWARLSAQLWRRSYADRMRILTDAGVVGDWHAADQHWLEVMMQDIETGQLERVNTYSQLCAQALAQIDPDLVQHPLPEALRTKGPPIGWPPGTPYPNQRPSVAREAQQTAELEPGLDPALRTAELAALVERGRADTLAFDGDATAALPSLEDADVDHEARTVPPPPGPAAPASPDDSGATRISPPKPKPKS